MKLETFCKRDPIYYEKNAHKHMSRYRSIATKNDCVEPQCVQRQRVEWSGQFGEHLLRKFMPAASFTHL